MVAQSASARSRRPPVDLPSHPLGYVAMLSAVITGVVHLLLAPRVLGFDQLVGILFVLNGLGFVGGVVLFVSRYWRREFYLVAALYALATIVSLFVVQGFGVEAFYMRGDINPMAVVTKAAEAVLALSAGYLYAKGTA